MKCLNCEKELINKRADTKFCSDRCTKSFSRNKSDKPVISDTIISDNKPDIIISDKSEPPKIQTGICHGCGRRIIDIKEQWVHGIGNEKDANNICICLPCVQKGITHKGLGLDIKECV